MPRRKRNEARPCSICRGPRETVHAYCWECRNEYRRQTRLTYLELPEADKAKSRCRAYTNVLVARGHLLKDDCVCGDPDVEAHHEDYTNPRLVRWLCRSCRMQEHSRGDRMRNVTRSTTVPEGFYLAPKFASMADILNKWG